MSSLVGRRMRRSSLTFGPADNAGEREAPEVDREQRPPAGRVGEALEAWGHHVEREPHMHVCTHLKYVLLFSSSLLLFLLLLM